MTYHTEAREITIKDDPDVQAATVADDKKQSERIVLEVVPSLRKLGIRHSVTKNGKAVRITFNDYRVTISSKTNGRYTCTIFSKTKSTDDALEDFPGSREIAAHGNEESPRRARIPLSGLDDIVNAIEHFVKHQPA